MDRPHEALGQRPPGSVYEASPREYPARLAAVEYPERWEKRGVRSNGEIRWGGELVYTSESLAGHWIGLEPVAERLWRLWFTHQALGWLDERKGTGRIRPLRAIKQ